MSDEQQKNPQVEEKTQATTTDNQAPKEVKVENKASVEKSQKTETHQDQKSSSDKSESQGDQKRGERNDRGGRGDRTNNRRGDNRGGRFDRRRDGRGRGGRDGGRRPFGKKPRNDKRGRQEEQSDLDSHLIEVKRVTRVVKGGKRMRFAALVVVGDRKGQVGMGFMKGMDFQDAVQKATRKAKDALIKIDISEDGSITFPIQHKFKAAHLFMKPATKGTGLIAGGYLRPVLELAGIENIYTKVLGSNNKISGVQAAIQALEKTKN
jgi:small subunit ribosomal protein S5